MKSPIPKLLNQEHFGWVKFVPDSNSQNAFLVDIVVQYPLCVSVEIFDNDL